MNDTSSPTAGPTGVPPDRIPATGAFSLRHVGRGSESAPTPEEVAAARARLLALDPDALAEEPDPEAWFMAASEVDDPFPGWPPAALYEVVFLQESEGHQKCDLIAEHGAEAAIERLRAWDCGSETRNTALFHGHYYDEPLASMGSRRHDSGVYVLTWNVAYGDVQLLRRFGPTDEAPAFWPDRTSPYSPSTPPGVGQPSARQRSVDQDQPGLGL